MKDIWIQNKTRSLGNSLTARYCASYFCRLRGLMFQNKLEADQGLLLVQKKENIRDASIHMLFVGMDLGIVWLNSEREVVSTVLAKSWRPYYAPTDPAQYVLEVNPVRLNEFQIGDRLDFEEKTPN